MKREAVRFYRDMFNDQHPRWLSFLGTSGVGKTMLARQIYRKFPGEFERWTTVARWVREGDHRLFYDLCNNRRCVVLDDIGSEYATDFTRSKLYELLSEREGKWTVITANLSLDQIGASLDTRIASRMLRGNSVVVDVNVVDYNLRKRVVVKPENIEALQELQERRAEAGAYSR